MRNWFMTGAGMLALAGFFGSARGDDGNARPRQYHIKCQVVSYDDNGKKVGDHSPELITMENRAASFFVGSEVGVLSAEGKNDWLHAGQSVHVTVHGLKGGKVRLDATVENSWVDPAPRPTARLRSDSLRSVETVRLGQTVHVELDKDPESGITYAFELTVQEADKDTK